MILIKLKVSLLLEHQVELDDFWLVLNCQCVN